MTRRSITTTVLGLLFIVTGIGTLVAHWLYDRSCATTPNAIAYSSMLLGALVLDPKQLGAALKTLLSAVLRSGAARSTPPTKPDHDDPPHQPR